MGEVTIRSNTFRLAIWGLGVMIFISSLCLLVSLSPCHADVYPNGLLVPYLDVSVSASSPGVLEKVFVQEGRWVTKGEVMAEMNASKEELDVQLTELELEELRITLDKTRNGPRPREMEKMEVDVKKAMVARERAQAEHERLTRLYAQKAISDKDLADAKNALDAAELSVKTARLTLDLAKEGPRKEDVLLQEMKITQKMATLNQRKLALDRLTVTAPVGGVIAKMYFAVGENVAGSPFCDILSMDSMYVELNLPVSELRRVKEGSKATVTAPVVSSKSYPGLVVFINPKVDPASRTFKIRIEIPNPEHLLKPGLFVHVSL